MTLGQFFHYAPWEYVPRIVSSGMLKPSNAGGAPEEPGLLWFSANQSWEPTATKIVPLHSGGVRRLAFANKWSSSDVCALVGLAAIVCLQIICRIAPEINRIYSQASNVFAIFPSLTSRFFSVFHLNPITISPYYRLNFTSA